MEETTNEHHEEEVLALSEPPIPAEATFLQRSIQFFFKELQNLSIVFYGSIVGIGMLFTYKKYAAFGINIFEYADIFDFLVAPFADFNILLYTALTLLVVAVLVRFDDWARRKYPVLYSKTSFGWDKSPNFNTYKKINGAVLVILYLGISSDIYATFTKQAIQERPPILLKYSDNHTIRAIPIGKTKEVLFLWHRDQVKAISINASVKQYEIVGAGHR